MSRSVLLRVVCLVLAAAGATVALAASSASAAVFPGDQVDVQADPGYFHSSLRFPFPGPGTYAGGELPCPNDHVPVAAGAVSGDPYGFLVTGPTTANPTSVFASAYASNSEAMDVQAQCARTERLSGSTQASVSVRDHTGRWRQYTRTVMCPAGTLAYGGGGGLVNFHGFVRDGMITLGSIPSVDRWTYSAVGQLGDRALQVGTRCLPREKLGRIAIASDTATAPHGVNRPRMWSASRCPTGTFAYAGGAWVHGVGTGSPQWRAYLSSSGMSADGRGWFATGSGFAPDAQLSTKVLCTDRLG